MTWSAPFDLLISFEYFTKVNKNSLVHLVVPKLEELISRTLLGLFKIRLLFQDRVRSQNLRLEWQCSTDHFLFKSSTISNFPLILQYHCFFRMDLLQLTNTCGLQDGKSFNPNRNFNGKRPGVLDLNKKWSVEHWFCDLTWSWYSNQILKRPSTIQEISSSNFGTTKCTRLVFLVFVSPYFL